MSGLRVLVNCLKHPLNYNVLTITRSYAVFPPHFIKPIFRHEDQNALTKQDLESIQHTPIRPALMTDTSSNFYDKDVRLFINYLMREGKKEKARKLVEDSFMYIKRTQIKRYHEASEEEKSKIVLDPLQIFHTAIVNCTPMLQLVKMFRGGIAYRVPTPINSKRATFLTMNWFIEAAKAHDRHVFNFSSALGNEFVEASEFTGRVITKMQELHRQCEANRAYAHYRWVKR